MGAAVTGWGRALPAGILTNAQLSARLGVEPEWILERTGIESRAVASPLETTSSLSTIAGRKALDRAGVRPHEIDLVLVATVTPDYRMPATASLVQHALGANNAGACDINAACSGFVYALSHAAALVEAKTCRKVLVCGAEVLSRITDYTDAGSCVLFGDGAGAVLVEWVEGPTRLGPFILGSDGSDPELLHIDRVSGFVRMNGREVYRRAVSTMKSCVDTILEKTSLTLDDVDLVVAHQANHRIVTAVSEQLGARPGQVMSNIKMLGNTSAASIPLALAESSETGTLAVGDRVIVVAFGAGFTWAAGLVTWGAPAALTDPTEVGVASYV